MAHRVRILQKETGVDQLDFPFIQPGWPEGWQEPQQADVEVMTPERLANMLRHDAAGVLDRFGMFIFDEAQLLKESGRGFTLESTIALLDYLTRTTDHQIVLISAAMGNAGAIAQWLSPDGRALRHESQWRGPRRLHAVFTTRAEWPRTSSQPVNGRVYPYRLITPLTGQIRLRMADGRTQHLTTTGDTGWQLVRRAKTDELYQTGLSPDPARTTKNYVIASEMIVELGHAGSILVVTGTRTQAQQLAQGLAQTLDERPEMAPLVDFVRGQLGNDHPLISCLRHGVGFHHAGLPIEVLEALEDAVREDVLPYLTCTSTLTDGVNLPVRTVVLYDQTYQGQPEDTRLRGARLVNAMGRAGRAGKETEGWIVLVRAAEPSAQDFDDLNPDADALAVTSSLITEQALQEFAELEQALREDQDALFRAINPATTSFISFIWLMLAIEEERGADPYTLDVLPMVDATLAAQQSVALRATGAAIAQAVRQVYTQTDAGARRRWPRTGTSIGSARTIDGLAGQLAATILSQEMTGIPDDLQNPLHTIERMRAAITVLMALSEAPPWRFRRTEQGVDIEVDPIALLSGWLNGVALPTLADQHLAAAPKAAWRIEQLVGVVTGHFEHYLSWTVGALIELVNAKLSTTGSDQRLCPELGGYIRYGVREPAALRLMTAGIRSRRLAHTVVAELPTDLEPTTEALRSWVATLGVTGWRSFYNASASEVLDLLDFTRVRRRSLLKTLLEVGTVTVPLPTTRSDLPVLEEPITIQAMPEEPRPAPLALYAGQTYLGTVAVQDQADIAAILDTGLDIIVELDEQADPPNVMISLPFDLSNASEG